MKHRYHKRAKELEILWLGFLSHIVLYYLPIEYLYLNQVRLPFKIVLLNLLFAWILNPLVVRILGDPLAVNRRATKINRRDEKFHDSLQGHANEPLGTDSYQTIWANNPLYYSAQSVNKTIAASVIHYSGSYLWVIFSFGNLLQRATELRVIISVLSKKENSTIRPEEFRFHRSNVL